MSTIEFPMAPAPAPLSADDTFAMPSHPDERQILVPFDARESMTLAAAAELCRKSTETIRSWAQRHGIGRKIGGTWHISRVALQMFLDDATTALSAYHAGDRSDPAVRAYFERAGCGALLQKSQKQLAPAAIHSSGHSIS
ncbi:MAG: helix-turn-helix domain-containing protein [Xanthobacteraceae bacterium]